MLNKHYVVAIDGEPMLSTISEHPRGAIASGLDLLEEAGEGLPFVHACQNCFEVVKRLRTLHYEVR